MNKNEIKIELTIQLSQWLDKNALIRRIKDKLDWLLATGGCTLVEIKEVNNERLPTPL